MEKKIDQLLKDIEGDREIDPDSLDVEWLNQSNLYYKYSSPLNDAIDERNRLKLEVDRKKEGLEEKEAELDLEVRLDPEKFEIPKITESVVKSVIYLRPGYQKAFNNYIQARELLNQAQDRVNRLYSCVNCIEEKKVALEQLVRLLNQQYFSTPQEPRDLSKKYQEKINQNKKEARNKTKERRRRDNGN